MNYNGKIKELELQYESLGLRVKNAELGEDISAIENKRLVIFEELRKLRRLQYDSQFVMNEEDYEY